MKKWEVMDKEIKLIEVIYEGAREAYPEYSEGQLIGKALAGARYREGAKWKMENAQLIKKRQSALERG